MNFRKILLTQGQFAIVNDADFEWLNRWKWRAHRGGNTWYAERYSHYEKGKVINSVSMHREILGLERGDGKFCDHCDGNGLNNQRSNLRIATRFQNGQNGKPNKVTSSNFKGVTWNKRIGKWQTQININGRYTYLGLFVDKIEAGIAYDLVALKHFGEFARLNFHRMAA